MLFPRHSPHLSPSSLSSSNAPQIIASDASPSRPPSSDSRPPNRQNRPVNRQTRLLYDRARALEKRGLWNEASRLLNAILRTDPTDARSHLALARLESRRERGAETRGRARSAFRAGTQRCPDSVHLWHAWAMHERGEGKAERARELLEKALELDPWNGYVCHSYGMVELEGGDPEVSSIDGGGVL